MGTTWNRRCRFGDQNTMSGTYPVVAIADGNIDTDPNNLTTLPSRGTRSNEIKINLNRQPTLRDLQGADPKSKVNLVSVSVNQKPISCGKTLKIRFRSDSSGYVSDNIWLGASFQGVYNTRQDKPISLKKGIFDYERELTIPENAPLGTHMLSSPWCM
jgi:hypothetical protein